MGREDHRRTPAGERPHHFPSPTARRWIEARGGLVEEEQARIPDDSKPQIQAALLTTGERLHPVVCLLGEADELEHLLDRPRARVVPGIAGEGLADRQERLDGELLKHDPHAFSQLATGRRVGRVVTEHVDVTPVTLAKALEDLDDRGLARAIGSEQREDLALVHLEGDVLHCFGCFVGLREMFHRDNRH